MRTIVQRVRSRSPFRKRQTVENLLAETREREAAFFESQLNKSNIAPFSEEDIVSFSTRQLEMTRRHVDQFQKSDDIDSSSLRSAKSMRSAKSVRSVTSSLTNRIRSKSPFRAKTKVSDLLNDIRKVEADYYDAQLDKVVDTSTGTEATGGDHSIEGNNSFHDLDRSRTFDSLAEEHAAIELVLETPVGKRPSPPRARAGFREKLRKSRQALATSTDTKADGIRGRVVSPRKIQSTSRGRAAVRTPPPPMKTPVAENAVVSVSPTKLPDTSPARTNKSTRPFSTMQVQHTSSATRDVKTGKSFLQQTACISPVRLGGPSNYEKTIKTPRPKIAAKVVQEKSSTLVPEKRSEVSLSAATLALQKHKSFRDRIRERKKKQQSYQLNENSSLTLEKQGNMKPSGVTSHSLSNQVAQNQNATISTHDPKMPYQSKPVFESKHMTKSTSKHVTKLIGTNQSKQLSESVNTKGDSPKILESTSTLPNPEDLTTKHSIGDDSLTNVRTALQRAERELTTKKLNRTASRAIVLKALHALAESLESNEDKDMLIRQLSLIGEERRQKEQPLPLARPLEECNESNQQQQQQFLKTVTRDSIGQHESQKQGQSRHQQHIYEELSNEEANSSFANKGNEFDESREDPLEKDTLIKYVGANEEQRLCCNALDISAQSIGSVSDTPSSFQKVHSFDSNSCSKWNEDTDSTGTGFESNGPEEMNFLDYLASMFMIDADFRTCGEDLVSTDFADFDDTSDDESASESSHHSQAQLFDASVVSKSSNVKIAPENSIHRAKSAPTDKEQNNSITSRIPVSLQDVGALNKHNRGVSPPVRDVEKKLTESKNSNDRNSGKNFVAKKTHTLAPQTRPTRHNFLQYTRSDEAREGMSQRVANILTSEVGENDSNAGVINPSPTVDSGRTTKYSSMLKSSDTVHSNKSRSSKVAHGNLYQTIVSDVQLQKDIERRENDKSTKETIDLATPTPLGAQRTRSWWKRLGSKDLERQAGEAKSYSSDNPQISRLSYPQRHQSPNKVIPDLQRPDSEDMSSIESSQFRPKAYATHKIGGGVNSGRGNITSVKSPSKARMYSDPEETFRQKDTRY